MSFYSHTEHATGEDLKTINAQVLQEAPPDPFIRDSHLQLPGSHMRGNVPGGTHSDHRVTATAELRGEHQA